MVNNPLDDKAQEFRNVVRAYLTGQKQGGLAPAGGTDTAPIDRATLEEALIEALKEHVEREIRAAVVPAVAAAIAEHGSRIDGEVASAAISRTVESAMASVVESQNDILVHLRNVLPGQIQRELRQHQRAHDARLAALEEVVNRLAASGGGARMLRRGLLVVLAVALVMVAVTIFERPIRFWGRQTLYPLFGLTVSELRPTLPQVQQAPPNLTTAR